MAYVTAIRSHDAEWLLQCERALNDQLLKAGRARKAKARRDRNVLSIGHIPDLEPGEVEAARRVVSRAAASLGPEAVTELLAVLGLDEVEQPRTRLCQGCKQRVPSADFADRGDGQARCPRCRARRPGRPLPNGVKRCSRCKVAKTADEYHANPASSDGLQSRCKPCRAIQERERVGRRLRQESRLAEAS
ncbi:hypothetical protein AB0F17_08650 [Nonomuraea sp. NPDC026600]|uniref:hypothetical protein n=1 Tax=Nonomuraea sp. NPDC026600 TaxID=3155363 RepID=UPI0033D6D771